MQKEALEFLVSKGVLTQEEAERAARDAKIEPPAKVDSEARDAYQPQIA